MVFMKSKKLLALLGSIALAVAVMMPGAAYAAAPETDQNSMQKNETEWIASEEKPMAHYYFNEKAIYKVSKEQLDEIHEKHNLDEIVARDGLKPVPQKAKKDKSAVKEYEMRTTADTRMTGR